MNGQTIKMLFRFVKKASALAYSMAINGLRYFWKPINGLMGSVKHIGSKYQLNTMTGRLIKCAKHHL